MRQHKLSSLVLALLLICPAFSAAQQRDWTSPPPPRVPFYLRSGDRVVFYGDSITEQNLYTTFVETYCVSRFPNLRLSFVNSGWGGDRVTGGGGGPIDTRIPRDILAYKPTVVTICLGMNDGGYRPFDPALFKTYVDGYRHIIETLLARLPGVRITLLTASAFDDVTRAPAFPGGYNSVLVAYGQAVRRLAQEYNLTIADTNAPLVALLARAVVADPGLAPKIIPDRVHPSPSGHFLMAAALLKAWHAPALVASTTIDASSGAAMRTEGCRVSGVSSTQGGIRFTLADCRSPWPIPRGPDHPRAALVLGQTTLDHDLNVDVLRVTGLTAPEYRLTVGGAFVANLTRQELEQGVNLASLASFPTSSQANTILALAFKHTGLHFQRWRSLQVPNSKSGLGTDDPADVQAKMAALDAQERSAVAQEQQAARPATLQCELTAVGGASSP